MNFALSGFTPYIAKSFGASMSASMLFWLIWSSGVAGWLGRLLSYFTKALHRAVLVVLVGLYLALSAFLLYVLIFSQLHADVFFAPSMAYVTIAVTVAQSLLFGVTDTMCYHTANNILAAQRLSHLASKGAVIVSAANQVRPPTSL